jgi:hypothetical protein
MLVARGYSQTYDIDYDETFAPMVLLNTVRSPVLLTLVFGWPLHQLDVKNAFLHGHLQEEVYMEVPPCLIESKTKAVCDMGYGQCNGDHTLFYKHSKQKITILAVSVDDIIDGEAKIARLKGSLSKTFEVKDLGRLKYFLGIEVA